MHPLRAAVLTSVTFLYLWTACRSAPTDRRPTVHPISASHAAPATSMSTAGSHSEHDPAAPVVVVSAPPSLRALETLGFDLGTQLLGHQAATTRELSQHAAYRELADSIASDLEQDRRRDRSAGVGMRHAHRQFDARWLSSDKTRFELIAVVNRLDRRVFALEHCGELRFIYRLAYSVDTPTGRVDSRLPMNVNLVRFQPRDSSGMCRQTAASWIPAQAASHDADWLISERGPLGAARIDGAPLKSVEVNLQSVRWPSTVRPNLGGHAEYILRVFSWQPQPPYLIPAKLENTIDAARLRSNGPLLKELVDWLKLPATLDALDAGTLLVPEKFLTERAVSVSPHGLARLTNRPYAMVLSQKDFEGADFTGYATLVSPASIIRRLDGLSCQGCHQSRSLAGFHLLGEDAPDKKVDALKVPMSPHFHSEVVRRRDYIATLAAGGQPEETRPPAERGPDDHGIGAPCGPSNATYGEWPCAAGLQCRSLGDLEVGMCLPGEGPSIGDPCEFGPITRAAAHRDAARLARTPCQGRRVCEANSVGFPGGMCAGSCDELPPGAVCGGIALLVEFNSCLASGRSFERCVLENTRPGALRACSFHDPCRDDYVCARVANGGACMPPYFLFQLRVDGHPI